MFTLLSANCYNLEIVICKFDLNVESIPLPSGKKNK